MRCTVGAAPSGPRQDAGAPRGDFVKIPLAGVREVQISGETIRLGQLLKLAGVARSGGEARRSRRAACCQRRARGAPRAPAASRRPRAGGGRAAARARRRRVRAAMRTRLALLLAAALCVAGFVILQAAGHSTLLAVLGAVLLSRRCSRRSARSSCGWDRRAARIASARRGAGALRGHGSLARRGPARLNARRSLGGALPSGRGRRRARAASRGPRPPPTSAQRGPARPPARPRNGGCRPPRRPAPAAP